jgi:hypothetical protein
MTDAAAVLSTPEEGGLARPALGGTGRPLPSATFTQALGIIMVVSWIVLAIGHECRSDYQDIAARLQPRPAHPFERHMGRDQYSRVLCGDGQRSRSGSPSWP